ncbi:MAG: Tol-Pal system beta propeller repeat protein TolB [Gammaproteobacteria bacterium]|nr:MAG: Tol-Pal system beta propeller repeat protein TolB [Gammaproteobacteria bacterium]
MTRRLALLLVLGWALWLPLRAGAGLTIEITSGVEGATPIAIVPFGWTGKGQPPPVDVAAVVAADLARSGRFAPLPRKELISRPTRGNEVNFRDWRLMGVGSLLVGRLLPLGKGRLRLEFQLFDTIRGSQLAGYSLAVTTAHLRQAAHYVSDVVYEALTGERGAFQTRIAYVTVTGKGKKRRYRLQVADADGYGQRTIVTSTEPLLSPAWSPDGRRLAYVSFEGRHAAVYVQEVATGRRTEVSRDKGINGAPAWSPDGTRLALTLSRDGNPEIYVLDLRTGRRRRLTHDPAIDTEPVWEPDGRAIIFTSDRGGGPQLYRIPLDGGRARRLTFEGDYNSSADISPDGRRLVFVHRDAAGHFRIALLDRRSGEMRMLSDGVLDESPSFAPNGSMVLYATEYRGRGVLAAVSVDGRVSQRLRFQAGDVREPAWSPFEKR